VFYGRLIRGVKNGPSPAMAAGQAARDRPAPDFGFLVDMTNFFTYDRNRPLHVFDADKVAGALRVHRAEGGETIDGAG
jgi:phenylalanyl-tRNA synthetase beta chain